jgi:hypothetical protein
MANATDDLTGINEVVLSYTIDDGLTWTNLAMIYNSTWKLYETTIQGQPLDTVVEYKIIAYAYIRNCEVEDNSGQYYVYTAIPEFTSFIILPLLALITLIATILLKKKRKTKPPLP